jgi:hypothetical protein
MKRRGFPAELLERRVVLHKMSRAQMEASAQPKRAQRAIRPARVNASRDCLRIMPVSKSGKARRKMRGTR